MDGRSTLNLGGISMTRTGKRARVLLWWTGLFALINLGPVQARGQEFPYSDHAWASLAPGLVGGGLVLWGHGLANGYRPIGLEDLQRLRAVRTLPVGLWPRSVQSGPLPAGGIAARTRSGVAGSSRTRAPDAW